jgi:hypothetical protein
LAAAQVTDDEKPTLLPTCHGASFDFSRFSIIVCASFCPAKEGTKVTLRHRKSDPLAEVIRSQQEEIKKYKWIESEKAGRDIGWERAAREWLQQHFPGWKQDRWNRFIKEALHAGDGLN